ncbi:MAG: ATP-binding protein [candidate division Zixibacteria bacterium]|nr:ATP-binding protein [candidate division Zixibacteria bacterium]
MHIRRFRDYRIITKQMIGFGLILFIMVMLNGYFITRVGELKDEIDRLTVARIPRVIAISDINSVTAELRLTQLQLAAATDNAERRQLQERMIALVDRINANRDSYEDLRDEFGEHDVYAAEEAALYDEYDRRWDEYQSLSMDFLALSTVAGSDTAMALLNGAARDVFADVSHGLVELVRVNRQASDLASNRAAEAYHRTRGFAVMLLIISVLVSGGTIAVFIRLMTRPVRLLAAAAGQVAAGNLDVRLPVLSGDEIGQLADSFNDMTGSLRRARDKTEEQARQLHLRHGELQKTYAQLEQKSDRLEKQKSEIEQANRDLELAMAQLRETQEQLLMKEKLASLGDLVAAVAHEINNPVGAILSSTDIARRCLVRLEEDDRSNEERAKSMGVLSENIRVMTTASERIATLVRSLKNFARLDEAQYQRVDIHEGLDASLHLLGSDLMQHISVHREYGELPRVLCYPARLNQVFLNLIKNAAESIRGDGVITIRTLAEQRTIRITISDTGRGIPRANLQRIFDIGLRATGERVRMGSGLGTAYRVIQEHGGQIAIDSELNKGTTVTITLPVR